VRTGGAFLAQQLFNSNSNLFRINTGLNYRFANGLTVGPTASYLYRDHNGYAAVEFAMIVPLMLVMFFGTIEFSSAVAEPDFRVARSCENSVGSRRHRVLQHYQQDQRQREA
jgi:hypothetical protein